MDKNFSPYAVIADFKLNGWKTKTRFCEKTLYNWVNQGIVSGVERTDLPNKGIKYREKGSTRRYSRSKCAGHSIDSRPKEVEYRKTFGHWELDTVKGGTDKGTECLFTMTERKSRREIVRKIRDAKGKSVVEVLDGIEKKIGSKAFRKIFITLTCDGGSEFMDIEGIERSCIDGRPRTKLYFAHPYTACERGTNENHNRILRRFFPKGCDFSTVTDEEVQQAEDWMNNYPRKIHGGFTPAMIYKKNLQFLTQKWGIIIYMLPVSVEYLVTGSQPADKSSHSAENENQAHLLRKYHDLLEKCEKLPLKKVRLLTEVEEGFRR